MWLRSRFPVHTSHEPKDEYKYVSAGMTASRRHGNRFDSGTDTWNSNLHFRRCNELGIYFQCTAYPQGTENSLYPQVLASCHWSYEFQTDLDLLMPQSPFVKFPTGSTFFRSDSCLHSLSPARRETLVGHWRTCKDNIGNVWRTPGVDLSDLSHFHTSLSLFSAILDLPPTISMRSRIGLDCLKHFQRKCRNLMEEKRRRLKRKVQSRKISQFMKRRPFPCDRISSIGRKVPSLKLVILFELR